MKAEYINPFIVATKNTFETMCGIKIEREGKLEVLENGFISTYELIGVLGLSGGVRGAVLMTMDIDVGCKTVGAFLGEEITGADSPDLMDGFGEILNIIAGAAAARMEGMKVNLALPTVVVGQGQQIHAKQDNPWVVIPMRIPDFNGKFNIEVTMEEA